MEHLNGCLHVIISLWKFCTCFSRMFFFSCNTGVRVLFCFHPVFVRTFTRLKFGVFPTCQEFFLTHFRPVLPLCRNQPTDLNYLLMVWFLNNGNVWQKWVKENLTGCLDITPAWKPYHVSEKCFFSSATQVRKLSSRFHSVLMGCFLSYIFFISISISIVKCSIIA